MVPIKPHKAPTKLTITLTPLNWPSNCCGLVLRGLFQKKLRVQKQAKIVYKKQFRLGPGEDWVVMLLSHNWKLAKY